MQFAALFNNNKKPSEDEINAVMSQVLCRCGTYPRIKKAIEKVVEGGAE
jgi:isoquinoline 1-oxidoreductase alpha subunit